MKIQDEIKMKLQDETQRCNFKMKLQDETFN